MERDPNDRFEGTGPRTPQPATGPGSRASQGTSRQMAGAMTGQEEGTTEQGIDTAKETANQAADQTKHKVDQLADTTKQKVNQVADQAKQKVGQAREKATQFKSTVADKLDQGADKLRQKTASAASDMQQSTTGNGATAEATKMNKMGGAVAGGMEKTADWLRTADLESVRHDIEHQVRSHPGRALVVALGLGYVVGRMFSSGHEG
ncbi:MAG TPA: hypothetical protein VFJ96_08225 [Gemmatimonadaceae bacterium]|nr:hypothetical protein [Gemmatimonadaceae bacterium]